MHADDLQRLVTIVMPYGKYKGRLLADLPGNYLNWFARTGFPANDLGRLLQLMQEIDHNGLSELLLPLRVELNNWHRAHDMTTNKAPETTTLTQMVANMCFCKLKEFCVDKNSSTCMRHKNIYAEFMQHKKPK